MNKTTSLPSSKNSASKNPPNGHTTPLIVTAKSAAAMVSRSPENGSEKGSSTTSLPAISSIKSDSPTNLKGIAAEADKHETLEAAKTKAVAARLISISRNGPETYSPEPK